SGSFMFKGGQSLSRGIFVMAWLVSVGSVPLCRAIVRRRLARYPWWGYSVVIIGAGETGRMVVELLGKRPELGLKPAVVLDDDSAKWGELLGVPILGGTDQAARFA